MHLTGRVVVVSAPGALEAVKVPAVPEVLAAAGGQELAVAVPEVPAAVSVEAVQELEGQVAAVWVVLAVPVGERVLFPGVLAVRALRDHQFSPDPGCLP